MVALPVTHTSFIIKLFPQMSAVKSNSQKKPHFKIQSQILDELKRLATHKSELQQRMVVVKSSQLKF